MNKPEQGEHDPARGCGDPDCGVCQLRDALDKATGGELSKEIEAAVSQILGKLEGDLKKKRDEASDNLTKVKKVCPVCELPGAELIKFNREAIGFEVSDEIFGRAMLFGGAVFDVKTLDLINGQDPDGNTIKKGLLISFGDDDRDREYLRGLVDILRSIEDAKAIAIGKAAMEGREAGPPKERPEIPDRVGQFAKLIARIAVGNDLLTAAAKEAGGDLDDEVRAKVERLRGAIDNLLEWLGLADI